MRALEILGRGRVEDDEPAEPMMLLEALLLGVEALRERGEDADVQAARLLDRKAMKLRARQEKSVQWDHYCYCGSGRREAQLVCDGCFREIPWRLLQGFHYAPLAGKKGVMEEIRDWCRLRVTGGRVAPKERRAA
jgi:hypothetical protein